MIEIAKILKPQGINGEVKVKLFSDDAEDFINRGFAYLKNGKRLNYQVSRADNSFLYLNIDGYNTRNDAELLHGVFLYIKKEELAELAEGEYYICDLIGLKVTDEKGRNLGRLKEILQNGAADVYVVKGEHNFMFPALKSVIVSVSKEEIVIDSGKLAEVAVYED